MNRIERMLRKHQDAAARNRVANWVATRDWSDAPIPYAVTEKASQLPLKAAE